MNNIIFGVGNYGQMALSEIGKNNVEYFVDNNEEKCNKNFMGIGVLNYFEYKKIANAYNTIVAVREFGDIYRQLEGSNIHNYEFYSPCYKQEIKSVKRIIDSAEKLIVLGIDESSEIILFILNQIGIEEDVIYADVNTLTCQENNTPNLTIREFGVIAEDQYTVLIASRNRAFALQTYADNCKKDINVINPFIPDQFGDRSQLIVNPYKNMDHDLTEKEWEDGNNVEINRISTQTYMEALKTEAPLFSQIEIETYNRCNGGCSFCPVGVGKDIRKECWMSNELFYDIIDQLKELNYRGRIATFSNNEPFLDDRIILFNRYIRSHLPSAYLYLFTNGTLLTLEKFIEIIDLLDELIIDNYNVNLELIPQVQKIYGYCKEHDKLKEKVTIYVRSPLEIRTNRGGDAPNRTSSEYLSEYGCVLPFKQIIVRPDGKISLCCNDAYGKYTLGDLTEESLIDIWYGKKFESVRNSMMTGRKNWGNCRYCDSVILF